MQGFVAKFSEKNNSLKMKMSRFFLNDAITSKYPHLNENMTFIKYFASLCIT